MKNRKLRSNRPLTFERLEPRLPLAGEVLLNSSGGSLKVTGDDVGNQISIVQDANVAGTFKVIANNGETFKLNGAAYVSGTDILGILKDISVDLKKGNDNVSINGDGIAGTVTARNVTIKTGAGADTAVIIEANLSGKVSIDTSAGDVAADNDLVVVADVAIAKTLSVKTGKGNDDVILRGVAVTANATVKTGDGSDNVIVGDGAANSTFGKNLAINTGTGIKVSGGQVIGGDAVDLFGTTIAGNVSMTTGGGADFVVVNLATAKKATISTGKGNDDVNIATFIDAAVTVDQVLLSLGAGDDDVVIGSDIFAAAKLVLNGPKKTKVNGGAGIDTLNANGDLAGAGALTATITGVETVNL